MQRLASQDNANNNMKHSPEYQSVDPHIEPLFKLHKLSEEEIANKKIPPFRLVSAAHNGPLFRLEKWLSPYLTSLSHLYLSTEFIRDTQHLTSCLPDLNYQLHELHINTPLHLFTLDVVQLYPSIQPDLCKTAIHHALDSHPDHLGDNLNQAIKYMIELVLHLPYIRYGNTDYKAISGIPTGGCTSRQEADLFMHWLLEQIVKPNIPTWSTSIILWRRFIDDIFGVCGQVLRNNFLTSCNC